MRSGCVFNLAQVFNNKKNSVNLNNKLNFSFIQINLKPNFIEDFSIISKETKKLMMDLIIGLSFVNENFMTFDWSVPHPNQIQKIWTKLKNILHLSQIHVPKINLDDGSNQDRYSMVSNSAICVKSSPYFNHKFGHFSISKTSYYYDEDDDYDTYSRSTLVDETFDRSKLTTIHESNLQQQHMSNGDVPANGSKSSSIFDKVMNTFKRNPSSNRNSTLFFYRSNWMNNYSGQHKLNNLAFQRNFHRSFGFVQLVDTNWLDLVRFALCQAISFVEIIDKIDDFLNFHKVDIYFLISGPGSGRTWQPILTSLIQVYLNDNNNI